MLSQSEVRIGARVIRVETTRKQRESGMRTCGGGEIVVDGIFAEELWWR
jgi:hypothetical protein